MHKSIADNSVPILMTSENAQKCFDGTKTQTRRIIKERPPYLYVEPNNANGPTLHRLDPDSGLYEPAPCPYGAVGGRLWVREAWAQVHPVQVVAGRFSIAGHAGIPGPPPVNYRVIYRGEGEYPRLHFGDHQAYPYREVCLPDCEREHIHPEERWHGWTPCVHMPKWACRTVLEITEIRVRQLQEITEEDAKAEGAAFTCELCGQDLDTVHGAEVHWACDDPDCTEASHREGFRRLWECISGEGSWDANPWVWVIGFKKVEGCLSTK